MRQLMKFHSLLAACNFCCCCMVILFQQMFKVLYGNWQRIKSKRMGTKITVYSGFVKGPIWQALASLKFGGGGRERVPKTFNNYTLLLLFFSYQIMKYSVRWQNKSLWWHYIEGPKARFQPKHSMVWHTPLWTTYKAAPGPGLNGWGSGGITPPENFWN